MFRRKHARRLGLLVSQAAIVASGLLAGGVVAEHDVASATHECSVIRGERWLGPGHDEYIGSEHMYDWVHGEEGGDRIVGNGCDDILWGNTGVDQLRGSTGHDRLHGGPGEDHTSSWNGNFSWQGGLYGGDGNDYIYGGDDKDSLHDNESGTDVDNLFGELGDYDLLYTNAGDRNDYAECGDGAAETAHYDSGEAADCENRYAY